MYVDLVVESAQARNSDGLAKRTHVLEHFGGIANQAKTGRDHQKRHRDQKPPIVVDAPDGKLVEHLEPEGAKLVNVRRIRTMLRNDGTNETCQADEHKQADGKTH